MDILIEQEKALHQFSVRQDNTERERLIHPTFREVGKSGTSFDFATIVEMMEGEETSEVVIHSQDYECIQLEPSVQLLLYKSALISVDGEVSNYAKRSSIWAFTGCNWQLKYHQGTPCPAFEFES
ncbi:MULTISPECIES: nuclear transport factor 2 family protein [Vibrio]|uniref:DUF4440 domain-containing protein n=1 Tax=Vibrio bivalvicida TaxID=1276888 RepID=A0ABV4MHB2_9VIBR|nr:DUF4440 domain-containing protein [Vibrio sp. VPAP30]KLN66579.1 hypothetical protein ZX61_02695 [Vibrio sp. VPAP30]